MDVHLCGETTYRSVLAILLNTANLLGATSIAYVSKIWRETV